MSDNSSRPHPQPAPTPTLLCSDFEQQLPLLGLDELDAHEAAQVRAHVEGCAWCQRRLREYETVLGVVRASLGADLAAASFTVRPEMIMRIREDTPATDRPVRESESRHAVRRGAKGGQVRRASRRLTTIGALAAALLICILASLLFAGHGLFTRGGQPGATASTGNGRSQVSIFHLPSSPVFDSPFMAVGSDGSLWSVENGGTPSAAEVQGTALHGGTAALARVSPSGAVTIFPFPQGQPNDVMPRAIAIGADGIVWVADEGNDALWRVDPHFGAMRQFNLQEDSEASPQARGGNLVGLAVEPDGKVWYLTDGGQELGQLDPATGTTRTLIPFDHPKEEVAIAQIAAISTTNGVLWLHLGPRLAGNAVVIGRFDSATGTLRKTDITSVVGASPFNPVITPAPDGSAWVSAFDVNQIVHILPDGTVKTFATHGATGQGFATDAQSNLWYLQANDDGTVSVIRVSPQGDFQTVETLPANQVTPPGMRIEEGVSAPDNGAIWLLTTTDGANARQDAVRIALPA